MTRLRALLDTLLPGGDGFPSASAVELDEWLAARPDFAAPVEMVLTALPDDFALRSAADRAALVNSTPAAAFERLLVGAYGGYYTHPDVLAVIERLTGYAARPPQPHGYPLAPFDPAMLDRMRRQPPSYREAPDEHS